MNRLYALVTGASEGLGKSLALELASKDIPLVLVSLPGSGLPQLSAFIRRNYAVPVVYFETDLTDTDKYTTFFKILEEQEIQVNILINNAGIGNWSWFEEKSTLFYKKQIELNVLTPVLLTKMFLEQTRNDTPAYILNVGSLGGTFVVPKKGVYGATKSFISYFTKCLRLELSRSNVQVSLLSPGGINTKPELLVLNQSLKGIAKATILEPEEVAKVAIKGLLKGKKEIVPGTLNKILLILNSILPSFLKEIIIKYKLKTILNT
jgi:short-subunit dehydrogenase